MLLVRGSVCGVETATMVELERDAFARHLAAFYKHWEVRIL